MVSAAAGCTGFAPKEAACGGLLGIPRSAANDLGCLPDAIMVVIAIGPAQFVFLGQHRLVFHVWIRRGARKRISSEIGDMPQSNLFSCFSNHETHERTYFVSFVCFVVPGYGSARQAALGLSAVSRALFFADRIQTEALCFGVERSEITLQHLLQFVRLQLEFRRQVLKDGEGISDRLAVAVADH